MNIIKHISENVSLAVCHVFGHTPAPIDKGEFYAAIEECKRCGIHIERLPVRVRPGVFTFKWREFKRQAYYQPRRSDYERE